MPGAHSCQLLGRWHGHHLLKLIKIAELLTEMLICRFSHCSAYAVLYLVAFGPLFISISVAADLASPFTCQQLTICDLLCNLKCEKQSRTGLSRRLEGPAAALEVVTVSNAAKTTLADSAESMNELIQRVVRVAEIQAQTTSDTLDPAQHKYPQAVETGGQWKRVVAGSSEVGCKAIRTLILEDNSCSITG